MPDLTSGEADVNYEIDRKYTDAGTYTVKLQFTYDRHGSQTHIDEVLDNGTLSLKLDNWVNIETDDRKINKFIERGVEGGDTQIPITFTISDNEEKEIKALKLEDDDNKEYHLEKVEGVENQYKTTFTLPTQSGKHTFKVKKVVYDQLTVTLPNTYDTTVEILKQRPTVDIVECNHNDRTIKFTVVDPEDTISEGKAEITSEDGQTVYKTIEINSNNVDEKEILLDFKQDKDGNPIPTDKKLKLKVTAKYSLDEDGEKQEEKELATQEIATLDIKYNFELQGVKSNIS